MLGSELMPMDQIVLKAEVCRIGITKTRNQLSRSPHLFSGSLLFLFFGLATLLLFGCTLRPYSHTEEFDNLRLTISSLKSRYEVGEKVTVTIVLENVSSDTVILEPIGDNVEPEYVFDIQVDGKWLSDAKAELQITRQELKPREKIEVEYSYLPDMQRHTIPIVAYVTYNHSNALLRQHASTSLYYGVKRK
jgi:hypothetical protein